MYFLHELLTSLRSSINVYESMSMIAIRCNRRQETVLMPKHSLKQQNWTIIFGIQLTRAQASFSLQTG